MDRIHDADDSGEHLFRYLRKRQRQVNAWFVIERGTRDYRRLRRDGYRRVVPHGSLRWKLLMANCQHLISSHADQPVIAPPQILRFMRPEWRFTFLQHGVIKDDISPWLNPKKIDIFVTSTVAEYESVAGDGTGYAFTSKETKLTGLPRFDVLLEAGSRVPPGKRDLVLLAPTWRNWLVPPLEVGSQRRSVAYDEFMASEFAQNWLSVIRSPELAEIADKHGVRVGFLPHPNLQPVLPHLDLPPHVEALGWDNPRELFARARLLVTDYSSMAFNAAYLDRPVVYFQFDRDRFLFGDHVGRIGYFDYQTQGFGPVTADPDAAVKAAVDAVEHGPAPIPEYQARIDATFPARDGRCCERVYEEIRGSTLLARPAALSAAGGSAEPRPATAPLRRRIARAGARRVRRVVRRAAKRRGRGPAARGQ
jgi:CDP-glycerol:poly(glycerophosphate) glycerophosphotransferase